MLDFNYYVPTRVVFGRDAEEQAGPLLKEYGCKKALLHFGGESARSSGLLGRIEQSLTQNGIAYVELGGVVPNPRMQKAYEGIELCKRENVDFILAVGGGSVIDSAKTIALGAANDFDVWSMFTEGVKATRALPIGAVLTLAAAGSEMSRNFVMTHEDGWLKRGCASEHAVCNFSLMNPALTATLPAYQTASGAVDIMMHTMERYFGAPHSMALTDGFCASLLRTVMQAARAAMQNPDDYDARAELMWASSLSHNGLLNCGNDGGDWSSHQLEHELGGMFDVAHGAGLAAVWGSWARYVYATRPARFAQYAQTVFGITCGSEEEMALGGIAATEEFFRSIDMPVSISELGIALSDEQIDALAHKCAFMGERTIGRFRKLDESDMREIYRMAR